MSIPIIIPTYHKMEQYIDSSLSLMKQNWPEHGKVFIISDNKYYTSFKGAEKVIRYDFKLSWIELLYKGLINFKQDFPKQKSIYLLLEDLIPLQKIDSLTIKSIENTFQQENWDFLYFPHYQNSFTFNIEHDNQLFSETPERFLFYSQIGVGLFNLDYLIQLCNLGLERKIKTPWEFEHIKTSNKHYITSYNWPTVRDGYSRNKTINFAAIKFIGKNGRSLKGLLIFNYILYIPFKVMSLIKLKRILNFTKRSIYKL